MIRAQRVAESYERCFVWPGRHAASFEDERMHEMMSAAIMVTRDDARFAVDDAAKSARALGFLGIGQVLVASRDYINDVNATPMFTR